MKNVRRRARLALLVAALLSMAACSTATIDRAGGDERDWAHPLRGGVSVTSASAAAPLVAFKIVEPSFDVRPDGVWVSDPQKVTNEQRRVVVFVYTLPDVGPVFVSEGLPTMDLATMKVRADASDAPEDAFAMVPVGTTQGLLSKGDGTSGIKWIKDGVQFDLLGRALPPMRARELASRV